MSDFIILEDEKEINNSSVKKESNLNKKSLIEKLNDLLINMQTVKVKDKVIFYRLLSTMTNAGMSVVKSVSVLEKQEKNPVFKRILGVFVKELKSGNNLSQCLNMFPASFETAEIGIIEAGEKTGRLNFVLSQLSDQIEKVSSMSGKIKSAMMYPMFILIIVFGVVFVMMTKVVPKLLDIFGYNGDLPLDDPINVVAMANLPGSTKVLINISYFFTNYWYVIILFIVSFIVFVKFWKKTPVGKYNYDNILINMPVFGKINKKLILSQFSRVFSGLISSGVSIVESLSIVSDAVGNEVYRQRILLLQDDVKQGMKIWESLEGDKLFPEMMIQMIQVGEQTAKLDSTIVKVADFYDDEVDNLISIINKLLEPFIIVLLAGVVGGIAVAIMEPIMNLGEQIEKG